MLRVRTGLQRFMGAKLRISHSKRDQFLLQCRQQERGSLLIYHHDARVEINKTQQTSALSVAYADSPERLSPE